MRLKFDKEIKQGDMLSKDKTLNSAYIVNESMELNKLNEALSDRIQVGDELFLIGQALTKDSEFLADRESNYIVKEIKTV